MRVRVPVPDLKSDPVPWMVPLKVEPATELTTKLLLPIETVPGPARSVTPTKPSNPPIAAVRSSVPFTVTADALLKDPVPLIPNVAPALIVVAPV